MRRAVFGSALLAGALVLSPLGVGAASAAAAPTPASSAPACPTPTESDLTILGSTPPAVETVGGNTNEMLSVDATETLYVGALSYVITAPAGSAATNATPSVTWDADGMGTYQSEVFGSSPTWDAAVSQPVLDAGPHTIVIGLSFAAGMPAGAYTASLQWSASAHCTGVSSPNSATFTESLPPATYNPPSAAGPSGGAGVPGGQPTDNAPPARASAAPPSTTDSAPPTATTAPTGDAASVAAAAVPSTGASGSGTEGTVTLTTSAPTSSDSATVWMLAAVFAVMLVGSVASGSIAKRRRLALEAASDGEPAGTADPSDPESGSGQDAGTGTDTATSSED